MLSTPSGLRVVPMDSRIMLYIALFAVLSLVANAASDNIPGDRVASVNLLHCTPCTTQPGMVAALIYMIVESTQPLKSLELTNI